MVGIEIVDEDEEGSRQGSDKLHHLVCRGCDIPIVLACCALVLKPAKNAKPPIHTHHVDNPSCRIASFGKNFRQ